MWELRKADPGKSGIPDEAVRELDRRLSEQGIRMHGYMLLLGNQIIAEKYWEPYGENTLHRMYSITKSFVALAVGLLAREGRIALEDPICDYFPEKLPEGGAHPWCREMTIRDMLTMRTCYASTTYKRYSGEDWTESFFRVEPDHVPGTVFSYDTSSAHVLCALVEKLTGKKLLDYMREKCLNRLGFSGEAYIIEDPVGVSQGGSGMMCTLRDVAKVAWLCNHYGVLDGEELLPREYLKEAFSPIVPTDLQPVLDEQCGYGFMTWMPRKEGFVLFGMGGQLAVCFPRMDFCFLTMADTIGNPAGLQIIYDSFYQTVYPWLTEKPESNPAAFEGRLRTGKSARAKERPAAGDSSEKAEEEIRNNTNRQTYSFHENPMRWKTLSFDWEEGCLRFEIPEGSFALRFGQGSWERQTFLNSGYRCECQGGWKLGHFILHCFVVDEEQGHVSMDFAWKDERMSVRMNATPEPFFLRFRGFGSAQKAGIGI